MSESEVSLRGAVQELQANSLQAQILTSAKVQGELSI
jgi:hypothetical protein